MSEKSEEWDKAFYAAILNAGVQNDMTLDRTLVTLSAAGIGLLLTLASTGSVDSDPEKWLFLISCISFIAAIILGVLVFKVNKPLLQCAAKNLAAEYLEPEKSSEEGKAEYDRLTKRAGMLDNFLLLAFIVGILTAAVAALLAGNVIPS